MQHQDDEMLEKKDIRIKVAPEIHAALKAMLIEDNYDPDDENAVASLNKKLNAYAGQIVEKHVRDRIHSVTVMANKLSRLGFSGIDRRKKG